MSPSRSAPRAALILKIDTLGDLVLFAPVLQTLRTAWPATRLVALIRRNYLDLAPLLAPGVEWLATSLDPFAQGPDADAAEVNRLRDAVVALAPDVVAAATSRRNWLEVAIAAAAPQARRLALGASGDDEFFATRLRVALGLNAANVFAEAVPMPAGEPDWRAHFALADALLGGTVPRVAPALRVDASASAAAAEFLVRTSLTRGRYVVCAAAGFANVRLKTWPATRFAAVLRHLRQHHGLGVLLVGHESERAYLESLVGELANAPTALAASPAETKPATAPASHAAPGSRAAAPRTVVPAATRVTPTAALAADTAAAASTPAVTSEVVDASDAVAASDTVTLARAAASSDPVSRNTNSPAPALWLGRDGSLPELAALLEGAALFVGNDTGAMHLAAAVDIPVVGIFGGGTWPRFVPAARRGAAVVHPLPCFGCGWDCAFGDAPCLGEITAADVIASVDRVLGAPDAPFRIDAVDHVSAETRAMMARAAARYREQSAGHLARQHKLEELTALSREKDDEIAALKTVCDEREKTIFILDGHVRNFQTENAALKAERDVHQKTMAGLPTDAAKAAQTIADLVVHTRNLEALLRHRENELTELRTSATNRAAGLHDLEQAKHYSRLLAEKETAIQFLREAITAREKVIAQLSAEATGPTAGLRKLWLALSGHAREKWWRPLDTWAFKRVVEKYWMQIGILRHYDPRPLKWDDRLPAGRVADAALPRVAVVTPSYGQEKFVERTLRSVLDQKYPKLVYVVQDGGSKDRSPEIIRRYAAQLHHWESVPDRGQADAIQRGFAHVIGGLSSDDVMAWLNSDDLLAPGSLRFVAEYFASHPDVDVIYGHRIIIDDDDRDVGRWIMPRHNPATLEWIDYVPQETLFWRKRAWDLAGGIDPSFQFALDWDLLARFQQAGCRMVRVPYFLGAFRVHAEQKTSQAIHTTGAEEMRRIRTRFHGERQDDFETINRHARHARFWGAITARLHEVGIRW